MFRAYILAIFKELQDRCGTGKSHAAYHKSVEISRCLTFCIKNLAFVEIRLSLNHVKFLPFTKSGVKMGAVFKRAAVTQCSGLISVLFR
jgi:hypothetical protein